MKTISLTQPFASLIVHGVKCLETRTWTTSHRGPLAIHASKVIPPRLVKKALTEPAMVAALADARLDVAHLPLGRVVGWCRLIDVLPVDHPALQTFLAKHPQERALGNFSRGRYAWLLSEVQRFAAPPVIRGQLGLFDIPQLDALIEGRRRSA
jgi:hypothetical protein